MHNYFDNGDSQKVARSTSGSAQGPACTVGLAGRAGRLRHRCSIRVAQSVEKSRFLFRLELKGLVPVSAVWLAAAGVIIGG